jgi:teichuronic acid exporter
VPGWQRQGDPLAETRARMEDRLTQFSIVQLRLVSFESYAKRLRGGLSNSFVRNLASMGVAQVAMRASRLATIVILSRFLGAEDYGLAAIVLTIYEMFALFTRNGISAKVVQAAAGEVEVVAQTAYHMTWIVCLSLVGVQALVAVPFAWLYGDMRLALPIAAMGLVYLATPACLIQGAFQQREGRLGRIALAGGLQVTVDNCLTATFAFLGFGMWAIILPKLLVAPIWVVCVRYGHAWRPGRGMTGGRGFVGWRGIARFSRQVVGVELMTTIQANIDNLMVGYFLGIQALGVYYFAFNAGLGMMLGLITAFGTAVFPHLCEAREDRAALTQRYRQAVRLLGSIVVPLILLQTFLAPLYVPVVFGEKWLPSVPVLMIICLSAITRPFATVCSQLLRSVGRPDIELWWQFGLTIALTAALALACQISITAVGCAVLAVHSIVLTAYFLLAPRPFLSPSIGLETGTESVVVNPSTADAIKFAIIADPESFAALREEWDALWSRAERPRVSQSFDWCMTGWRTTANPRARKLNIIVGRIDGRLVMVWPMTIRRCMVWNIGGPLGAETTEYDPLLVESGYDTAANVRAIHEFVRRDTKIAIVAIPFVEQGSPRQQALTQLTVAKTEQRNLAPFLSWGGVGPWDDYWRSRSANLRSGTKRRQRRLEQIGQVAFEFIDDGEQFDNVLAWTLRMKIDWLARKRLGNDFIHEREYREFLSMYWRKSTSSHRLVAMIMTIDGRLIASKLGTVDHTRFEGFITVYDNEFEDYSPGVLLLANCLRWCCQRGLEYDFRIGGEAYKFNWANQSREMITYEIANGAWGTLYLAFRKHHWLGRYLWNYARRSVPAEYRERIKSAISMCSIARYRKELIDV